MGWVRFRRLGFFVMVAVGALLLISGIAAAKLIETGTMTDAEGSWDFTLVSFTIITDPPSDPRSLQPNSVKGVMAMVVDETFFQFKKAEVSGELVYLEIRVCHPGGECMTVDMTDVAITGVNTHVDDSTGEQTADVNFTVTGTITSN